MWIFASFILKEKTGVNKIYHFHTMDFGSAHKQIN